MSRTSSRSVVVALMALAGLVVAVFYSRSIASSQHIVGNVRVTALSPTLVRLEERGPLGFEDRETFHVVGRSWPGSVLVREETQLDVTLTGSGYSVVLPAGAQSLADVKLLGADGSVAHIFRETPEDVVDLPAPGRMPAAWVMPDAPRLVPAPWGATPAPADGSQPETSGWDAANGARDVYVFITAAGGYQQLRDDFLTLTGRVPMPPRYAFGYWTSRWHPYSESTALAEIDAFRARGIPLDVFVVDTDWRVGASEGYAINRELFPDMKRFIAAAHERHVRLMFNDHPEPLTDALSPAELRYRWEGLTSLLALGADVWWYDRNWHTVLREPMPGLGKETWGMRVYHDITRRFRPSSRPLIMSNVDGITSGIKHAPSDPAAHRFPIWWTGDTQADWPYLTQAVLNAVNAGVESVLPYVSDDCGGFLFKSTPELYTRFMQYCALSPILRAHAGENLSRLPWDFDAATEDIVRRYAKLRYRLMPVLYSAAHRAHLDGTPMLRRLDLEWPQERDAADPTQYLLGDDLLVAPILEAMEPFSLLDGEGLQAAAGPGVDVELRVGSQDGQVLQAGTARTIAYRGWPVRRRVPEGIVGRWSTTWNGVPETGDWRVRLIGSGVGKLWIDDSLVVDDSLAANDHPATVRLERGKSYRLRVEVGPTRRLVTAAVLLSAPSLRRTTSQRSVWFPPGEWEDLWTGERRAGPARVTIDADIERVPMFVRVGGIVMTTREMQFVDEAPWDPVVVDVFVPAGAAHVARELYEDDGVSTAYLDGKSRTTRVELQADASAVRVTINAAQGEYDGAIDERRWVVRMHLPDGAASGDVRVDGRECGDAKQSKCEVIKAAALSTLFEGEGAPAAGRAGPVVEVKLGPVRVEGRTKVELMRSGARH